MVAEQSATGTCFCGGVRFTVRLPSMFCGHCHCTMCRRAHGAGYVTWFAVAHDQFALDDGEDRLVHYPSSDHGTRSFCGTCGSTLFCESTHHTDRIDIVLANMQGPIDRDPEGHVYFDDRARWIVVNDGLPRLGGTSGLELLADEN